MLEMGRGNWRKNRPMFSRLKGRSGRDGGAGGKGKGKGVESPGFPQLEHMAAGFKKKNDEG